MSDTNASLNFFFQDSELDEARTQAQVGDILGDMDDGELYLEATRSESFTFDDGRLKGASFDSSQGFGLRAVLGESTGFAHSNELSEAAIKRAGDTVRAIKTGNGGEISPPPIRTNRQLYTDESPIDGMEFGRKIKLLEEIDAYARAQDDRIANCPAG